MLTDGHALRSSYFGADIFGLASSQRTAFERAHCDGHAHGDRAETPPPSLERDLSSVDQELRALKDLLFLLFLPILAHCSLFMQ